MEFIGLGYGETIEHVMDKINENGQFVVIRDDDAANVGADHCWFAVKSNDVKAVEQSHEDDGGTVSATYEINVKGINPADKKHPKMYRVIDILPLNE